MFLTCNHFAVIYKNKAESLFTSLPPFIIIEDLRIYRVFFTHSNIEKIEITNGKISSGVLIVTDIIPEGKNAFAFIITSSTNVQAHTAQIWKNLNNGSVNVSFKLWSDATPALVMNSTVSGILLCI